MTRIHLIGIPHTKTSPEFQMCAFTQKILKLSYMLPKRGYEVIHYGTEGAKVGCEHVTVLSDRIWQLDYGRRDPKAFYDLAETDSVRLFNLNVVSAIRARAKRDEIILFPFGQWKIAKELPEYYLQVESGVGYNDIFAPYAVFESNAWMHYIYGKQQYLVRWYDTVIPNYFDPEAFYISDHKESYFLYMGRLIYNKGVNIAADVARKLGVQLVIAGQGNLDDLGLKGADSIVFVGPISDPLARANLLAHALAVFCPTQYVEPFGGIAVEAMMCGTPVISSDCGAFTETVLNGVTGWRCSMFDDFVWAATHLEGFNPRFIRQYAIDNYSLDRCGEMYDLYFQRLLSLTTTNGWMQKFSDQLHINWMKRR